MSTGIMFTHVGNNSYYSFLYFKNIAAKMWVTPENNAVWQLNESKKSKPFLTHLMSWKV